MDLYLVRHAEAEPRSGERADAARALTLHGRERFRRAVRGLARLRIRFDRIHHSPHRRALETAQILTRRFAKHGGETRVTSTLVRTPDESLLSELAPFASERVALVGHEPYLSELAFWLATGWSTHASEAQPAWIELDKGGVAHLRGTPEPAGMRLVAVYDARTLRRLAGLPR